MDKVSKIAPRYHNKVESQNIQKLEILALCLDDLPQRRNGQIPLITYSDGKGAFGG